MPEATVSAGFCEGEADLAQHNAEMPIARDELFVPGFRISEVLQGFRLRNSPSRQACDLQRLIAGTDVIQSRNGTQPKSRWAYDNTEGISFEAAAPTYADRHSGDLPVSSIQSAT
jgi:hypothetical protein